MLSLSYILTVQFAGAGRDGKDSVCMLLMCAEDLPVLEGFARGDTPSLSSLEAWLEDVCNAPKEDNGRDIYVSNYQQEREFDIRVGALHRRRPELT